MANWRRWRRWRPNNSPDLVRPLDYHAQEPNIPFGNPSLRCIYDSFQKRNYPAVAANNPFTFLFTYPSRTADFNKVGHGVVFKLLETVPIGLETWCGFCSRPEQPCECRFSISCWKLLLCSVCLCSYQLHEGTLNQGSWWTKALNCQCAFTLPYFILKKNNYYKQLGLGNVQETVKSRHLT